MDLSILTTVFCFISLVLGFTALSALSNLKAKVNAHLDRTDLHSEKLATIISILQQIEAKQDLMFSNAPPFPGESDVDSASFGQVKLETLAIEDLSFYQEPVRNNRLRQKRKDAGIKRGPYNNKRATAQQA